MVKTPLRKSLLGFFDYLVFIEEFSKFLKEELPGFSRSVHWHYHGYWFKKIAAKLSDSIEIFFYYMGKFIHENKDDKKFDSNEWFTGLEVSRKIYLDAVEFMLDPENESPLIEFRDSLVGVNTNMNTKSEFEIALKKAQADKPPRPIKTKLSRKR